MKIKAISGSFKLLIFTGLGTGALCYHLVQKWSVRLRTDDPRETVGQREVESLTRGDWWMHLPMREMQHTVPMTFSALGVLSWPVLVWRYGFLLSTLLCVPFAVLQVCTVALSFDTDRAGIAYLLMLLTPASLAATALALSRLDLTLRKRRLQRKGWVSQGRVWVPRGLPLQGRLKSQSELDASETSSVRAVDGSVRSSN